MIEKEYTPTKRSCRVTFTIPADDQVEQAAVVGEFNDWDPVKGKMPKKIDSGNYALTISLKPGNNYRFRYLINDSEWSNDSEADGFVDNEYGTQDSVIAV